MNKKIAVILAVLLTVSLAGCGSSSIGDTSTASRRGPAVSSAEESVDETSSEDSLFASQEETTSSEVEASSQEESSETASSKDESSKNESSQTTSSAPVSVDEPKMEDDSLYPVTVKSTQNPSMSDKIFDHTIKIGDKVYKTPLTVKDFESNGWKLDNYSDTTMKGNSYALLYFNDKDGHQLSAYVTNYTHRKMDYKYCYITGFRSSSYNLDKAPSLELAKGIKLNSSKLDDVKTAYGEPDEYDKDSDGTTVKYKNPDNEDSYYDYLELEFNSDGLLTAINDSNDPKEVDGFVEPPINSADTALMKKYVAPTEVGDDLLSGTFLLDASLYQLPCPLKEFVDDGWKFELSDNSADLGFIGSGDYVYGKLKKYGYELSITVFNDTDFAIPYEHGTIYQMNFSASSVKDIDLKFPTGITLSTKKDEIDKIENISKDEMSSLTFYELKDASNSYNFAKFTVVNEDGSLQSMEIGRRPKDN